MTLVVPEPAHLEMPPGDPAALEELVQDVAAAGHHLAVVRICLGGASAPGWRGADASAAAAQIGVVAALTERLSAGVAAAVDRLRTHHDHLTDARRRIAALRAEQDEDFRGAWGHLARIADTRFAAMTGAPEAVAVVEELQAAEARRRREHGRLLQELADDAAGAARALADARRTVGGTGRHGDSGLVVAHLAAELPGWGAGELRRRGSDLAAQMWPWRPPEEREALARQALPHAGSAAFAGSFLAGLGSAGVRDVLLLLGEGYGDLDSSSALARVLALALGAGVATGRAGDALEEVLRAGYVDPEDPSTSADLVALGMGVVLVAGGPAGPQPGTVVSWGRQMLAREAMTSTGFTETRSVDRAVPLRRSGAPVDPVAIVAQRLAGADDPSFAATLLAERRTWDALLTRTWDDDALSLRALIAHAGTAADAAGEAAAKAGLEVMGARLSDGNPADRIPDPVTAAVVAPALASAVVAHPSLAALVLGQGASGSLGRREGDLLHGLGSLTCDADAARALGNGLRSWARIPPESGGPSSRQVVEVFGAFVAAQEYGQRLRYALDGFEQQVAAEDRARNWNLTVGLLAELVRRTGPGSAAGLAADYAAIYLGFDGTYELGPDEGTFFVGGDASRTALENLPPGGPAAVEAVEVEARRAYDRTLRALGRPMPPSPPEPDYLGPLIDAAGEAAPEMVKDAVRRRLAVSEPPG